MKKVNNTSQFAIRTLSDFSHKLLLLLEEKRLEEISGQKLCNLCHYPRSTFYNYFEDIYDLMDYCWKDIMKDIDIEKYLKGDEEKGTLGIFVILYDYFDQYRNNIHRIFTKNTGRCMNSLRYFMRENIKEAIRLCSKTKDFPLREDVMVEYYALNIEMLLEKCFLEENTLSKQEAIQAVKFLLGTVEREVHKG